VSSANRGRIRNADDLYETPHFLIEAYIPQLVSRFMVQGKMSPAIWEPCAGNGRIVRVLKHHFPHARIIASDLQDYPDLDFTGNFLEMDATEYEKFDLIISNPPFFRAQEVCQHAMTFLKPDGTVAMLERIGFLGSKQREPWLSNHVPDVALSPRRASFLPTRQADSVEYSWLSWSPLAGRGPGVGSTGTLTYLDTLTCDECAVHYDKICPKCDYGYCKSHYKDHECKLFGADFLWGCINHPEIGMQKACKAKVKDEEGKNTICGQPLCADCWTTHAH
jgi:hypothetical protein